MTKLIALLAVGAAVVAMVPPEAMAISGYGLLRKLVYVDGAGSGLDADRVQGKTPDDIINQAAAAAGTGVGTAIAAFLDSAYTKTGTVPVSDGYCNSIDAACNDANDFLLNCGGAVNLTTGYLTTVSEVPGANGTCRAAGCGFGGATSVAVTATCLVR